MMLSGLEKRLRVEFLMQQYGAALEQERLHEHAAGVRHGTCQRQHFTRLSPHASHDDLSQRCQPVTGPQRAQSLPDVPTIAELGYTGFSSGSWAGIAVPKGTPAPIVDRLHEAVEAALADPEVKERLASLSFTTLPGSQADFKARIQQEAERYGPIIEALNLHR